MLEDLPSSLHLLFASVTTSLWTLYLGSSSRAILFTYRS